MNTESKIANVRMVVGTLGFIAGMFGLLVCVVSGEKVASDIGIGVLLTSPLLAYSGVYLLRSK